MCMLIRHARRFIVCQNLYGTNMKNQAVYTINPGLRYAYNAGSLQIVSGLAAPIELNGEKTKRVFFYLSFEHPF